MHPIIDQSSCSWGSACTKRCVLGEWEEWLLRLRILSPNSSAAMWFQQVTSMFH